MPELDVKPRLTLDAEITLPEVNQKLISDMAHLEPFGNENSQPIFYVKGASLLEPPQLLKDAHTKCMLFADHVIKPIIFFNRPRHLYALSRKPDTVDFPSQIQSNRKSF